MLRFAVVLLACGLLPAQTETEWINRGVQAFKSARYAEAIESFERAVAANPGNATARLYLATAHMQQYIPGAEAAENIAHADRAQAEFERVLAIDPGSKVAVASMASLMLNRKRFEEARTWYGKLLVLDPSSATAYYSIAFSIWAEWYPAYASARQRIGMRPETPGPIPDPGVRNSLRTQWWTKLEDGIYNLKRALDLAPDYADAMAYLNLFIRERADLLDSQAYDQEIAEADRWVQRALEAKKKGAMIRGDFAPPPPPPPPPPSGAAPGATPQRIRVGSTVQAARLVRSVRPVYPPLAREARIEGTVKLDVIIAKDGTVQHIEVRTGHPLLVPAALDAVKQWVYQPTLLNGEPVEVVAQIDVNFPPGN